MFGVPLLYLKLAGIAILSVALFGAGWMVKGWKDDSQQAAEQKAVQAAVNAFHDHESRVGKILEDKLASLRANKTIVEKHRETISERPVYLGTCLDNDGVQLIEAARRGVAPASEPASALP